MDDPPVVVLPDGDNGSAADDGTAVFAAERPRLTGIAYRILGSLADADDVVQEAWLRFSEGRAATTIEPAGGLAHHRRLPDRPRPPEGRPPGAGGLCRAVAPGADRLRPADPVAAGAGGDGRAGLVADAGVPPRAGDAEPGGAGRLRPGRRVRRPVQGDRRDGREVARRLPADRLPGPAAGARRPSAPVLAARRRGGPGGGRDAGRHHRRRHRRPRAAPGRGRRARQRRRAHKRAARYPDQGPRPAGPLPGQHRQALRHSPRHPRAHRPQRRAGHRHLRSTANGRRPSASRWTTASSARSTPSSPTTSSPPSTATSTCCSPSTGFRMPQRFARKSSTRRVRSAAASASNDGRLESAKRCCSPG